MGPTDWQSDYQSAAGVSTFLPRLSRAFAGGRLAGYPRSGHTLWNTASTNFQSCSLAPNLLGGDFLAVPSRKGTEPTWTRRAFCVQLTWPDLTGLIVGKWVAAVKRLASAVRFRPWPPCFQ